MKRLFIFLIALVTMAIISCSWFEGSNKNAVPTKELTDINSNIETVKNMITNTKESIIKNDDLIEKNLSEKLKNMENDISDSIDRLGKVKQKIDTAKKDIKRVVKKDNKKKVVDKIGINPTTVKPYLDKSGQLVDIEVLKKDKQKNEEVAQPVFKIPEIAENPLYSVDKVIDGDKYADKVHKNKPVSNNSNLENLIKEYKELRDVIQNHYLHIKDVKEETKNNIKQIKENKDKTDFLENKSFELEKKVENLYQSTEKLNQSITETDKDVKVLYEELEIPYDTEYVIEKESKEDKDKKLINPEPNDDNDDE